MILDDGVVRIDTSDFDRGLENLVRQLSTRAIAPGLFMMGNALLKDAIYIPPQAPKDIGDLRGSARTQMADGKLRKATDAPGTLKDRQIVDAIKIGFNIVYAAKWHEAVGKKINWTTDKGAAHPGPKYLELKLRMFNKRYLKILSDYIAKVLGKKVPS
jgi:hypothetical protein